MVSGSGRRYLTDPKPGVHWPAETGSGTMRKLIGLALAVALAACAPQADGPAKVVEALYAPYIAGQPAPGGFDLAVLTPELKAELDRATTYGDLLDAPIIDFDPLTQAQDWQISAVSVAESARDADTATVTATFQNAGTPTEVPFQMRLVEGAWRIDEIGAGETSLRAIIAAAIRPLGSPTAMEAPVRAVYDVYRAATRPVAPLHRWAPLSETLRARAARVPELDFDPVVDGKGLGVGPVQYEAAAGSVIVRFDKEGEARLLVYDLVEEGGAWKIADIRAPGHWGYTAKLAEAGAP